MPQPPEGTDPPQVLGAALSALQELSSAGPLTDQQRKLLCEAKRHIETMRARWKPTRKDDAPAEPAASYRPSVLVVDDDPSSREAMREVLETEFQVVAAEDADGGLVLLSTSHPDVVVTDLCMPAGGGTRILEGIHENPELSLTPVLVLSGTSEVSEKVRAFDNGAFDFMCKPVGGRELLARVKNALRRSTALRQERKLQETDDLTGLPNRRSFRAVLHSALEVARFNQRPLTVAMVDQNELKQINDNFGHAAGDQAIRTLAQGLTSCKRSTDCAARLGGDEFAVIIPDADRSGAQAFISRVEGYLGEHPLQLADVRVQVTACFGLATLGDASWDETAEKMLERADAALYEAKRNRPTARKVG